MRLDRFVSQADGISRAQARRLVRKGRVQVDGAVLRDPAVALGEDAQVVLAGRALVLPGERYLQLHKPAGFVCATRDDVHATVRDLLPALPGAPLQIVGRLDRATTGLLLFTTDGGWNHRITAPRAHCPKTYLADLADPLDAAAATRLREGVVLRDAARPTAPAGLQLLDERRVRIRIVEGRYHQVRRMFAAVGNRVESLHREAVGGLPLDPGLAPGEWCALDARGQAAVFADPTPLPVT